MNDVANRLADEWRQSGVCSADTLLVHSSIKRLLLKINTDFGISASPELILQSLLLAIGENGTLVLPTFNFDFPTARHFDIRTTKSQMGALTEVARLREGSIRTGHPIYSFAVLGKNKMLFKGIYNYSGYGKDSPFALLKELDARIAIIGLDDQNSMTSYHYVEESNAVDYRYHKKFEGKYIDWDGKSTDREFGLFVRDLDKGVKTNVNRMMSLLWEKNIYKGYHPTESFGMRTIKFREFYVETERIIQSGKAIDYLYSIEK